MRVRLCIMLGTVCLLAPGFSVSPAAAAEVTIAVSGTVLDDAGRGLPGADVRLNEDSATYDDAVEVVSNDAGRYTAEVTLTGNRDIDVSFSHGDGWSDQLRGIDAQDGADVVGFDGQLQELGSISGRITSQVSSVDKVYMHLTDGLIEYQDALHTEADGSYRFDDVPPGRYWLELGHHDDPVTYSPTSGSRDAVGQTVVAPGEDVTIDYVARPKPAPELGRLVVTYSGRGLGRNADLEAYRVGAGYAGSSIVTSDYPTVTLDLAPGQYKLALDDHIWFGGHSRASAAVVTVSAGRTTSIAADLPSNEPDSSASDFVQGRFYSEEGVGIPNLDLEVLRPDAPGEVVTTARTSFGGGFTIDRLAPGDYLVRASDPTGTFRGRTVLIPDAPRIEDTYVLSRVVPFGQAFAGPPSASLGGRSLGGRGGPICLHPTNGRAAPGDLVCGSFDGESEQRYAVTGIKPGSYRIRLGEPDDDFASWVGGRSEASASVITFAAGEDKQLDLPLRRTTGHFVGRAVDRAGRAATSLTYFAYAADNPDEVIAVAQGGSFWGMYYLDVRGYKIKVVDGTGRYDTTWLGGEDFASASTVTPLIGTKKALPPVVLTERVAPASPPRISGAPVVGGVLTATPGVWASEDLTFAFQWLRDGSPIPGANTATYTVTTDDVGSRLTVRVDGRDPWGGAASTTSRSTDAVTRPAAPPPAIKKMAPRVKTSVKALGHRKVRIIVTYTGSGPRPTGRVSVRRGSKTVVSWKRLANGKYTATLRHQPRGRLRYTVRYSGSGTYLSDTRQTPRVRVR